MTQETLTKQQIQAWENEIAQMTRVEMARLYRFALVGHPLFRNDLPLSKIFKERFDSLGRFSPSISKALG